MKIIHVKGGEYKDVIGEYSNFEEYDDGSTEEVFFYGYNSSRHERLKDEHSHYKRKVYLNLEAPCSFMSAPDAITSQAYFDQVYTICPYTSDWLNGKGKTIYIPVMYPYKKDLFDKYGPDYPKTKDVIYQGGLYSSVHTRVIDMMREYNYVFCSLFRANGLTHRNVNSKKKWDLVAAAKCSVAINLLYPSVKHMANIRSYNDFMGNEAFKQPSLKEVPQTKIRMLEAAACRTLNLVMRDDWNVVEYWFDKDEFVYWETIEELKWIISDVKENYYKYLPMIERAYNKVQRYTSQSFYDKVIAKRAIY